MYIITTICVLVLSILANCFTFAWLERPERAVKEYFQYIRKMPVRRWSITVILTFWMGFVSICLVSHNLDAVQSAKMLAALFLLDIAAVIDCSIQKIPNRLVLAGMGMRILFFLQEWLFCRENFAMLLITSIAGMAACFLFFFIMSVLTRHGIGMGDVKLLSMLGFFAGLAGSFYAVFIGMVLTMCASVGILVMGKKGLKDSIPFGPFLFGGFCFVLILGKF